MKLEVPAVSAASLAALQATLDRALATGSADGLAILGYGEVSCVLAWEADDGTAVAAKCLPPFADEAQLARYTALFDEHLAALAACGVDPVPSRVVRAPSEGGGVRAWVLQPLLPAGSLLTDVLRTEAGAAQAEELFGVVLERIEATADPARLALDSQLSNWARVDVDGAQRIVYLDVTTPLMRDAEGRERLDADLFLASMPWALRGFVRRFMLGSVVQTFYEPRSATVDCLGNLVKEGLDHLLPRLIAVTAGRFEPAITEPEVRRFYRGDARTWELLLRLRRMDRWWQRKVRRRVYPFLLPPGVDRKPKRPAGGAGA